MNQASPKRSLRILPRFPWHAVLALGLLAGTSRASTNFVYDAYVTPSTLPQNPPWTTDATYVNGTDSQTASGRLLTLVKDITFNDPGYYYSHTLALSEISSTTEYSVRTRARLNSFGDNYGEHGLLQVVIGDGTIFTGIGMSLGTGGNRFFLLGSGGTPLGGVVYTATAPSGDDFFNILLTKTGTTGTSADQVNLYVDGVLAMTQNYGNMAAGTGRNLTFGASSSVASGTIQMTGASFGIGESAPSLIPEPSALAMGVVGLVFGRMKLRRRA